MGDELYIYYGGYTSGHKTDTKGGRQLGLVTMPLDRFVAWDAKDSTAGRLMTVPIAPAEGRTLLVNANAADGALRCRLLDESGNAPLPGYGYEDCAALSSDGLRLAASWGSGTALPDVPYRIEFELRDASLFGFSFQDSEEAAS